MKINSAVAQKFSSRQVTRVRTLAPTSVADPGDSNLASGDRPHDTGGVEGDDGANDERQKPMHTKAELHIVWLLVVRYIALYCFGCLCQFFTLIWVEVEKK